MDVTVIDSIDTFISLGNVIYFDNISVLEWSMIVY